MSSLNSKFGSQRVQPMGCNPWGRECAHKKWTPGGANYGVQPTGAGTWKKSGTQGGRGGQVTHFGSTATKKPRNAHQGQALVNP